jgi:hypothetical protein
MHKPNKNRIVCEFAYLQDKVWQSIVSSHLASLFECLLLPE